MGLDYSKQFQDLMDNINNIAKDRGFVNGIAWAKYANERGEISYSQYQTYDKLHSLRVNMAHGHARDIVISSITYNQTKDFKSALYYSRLRKQRRNPRIDRDNFRNQKVFRKSFDWTGYGGRKYHFSFTIRWECVYERGFSDHTHISGYTYLIYVDSAPCYEWCREHNLDYEFHFYDPDPYSTPTICWNKLVKSFEMANGIMLEWAKNYSKILNLLYENKTIDENKINRSIKRRGIIPSDSFRKRKNIKKINKETIYIEKSVYDEIMTFLGKKKPEMGGMLGWRIDSKSLDYFVLDQNAFTNGDTYSPNVDKLNGIISGKWNEEGIWLAGFVHSHPGNARYLSNADINYGLKIIKSFDMDFIILPIVTSSYEYKSHFYPYIVWKDGTVEECDYEIYESSKENETCDCDFDLVDIEEIAQLFKQMGGLSASAKEERKPECRPIFDRISSVINLERMKKCAIVGVGVGGARSFYENMARLGVGNIYLIDGDETSLTNIASQNGFLSEVGIPKVESVKKRILDINDECNVITYNFMLDDSISDEWVYDNILSKYDKKDIVLCGSTDDFFAQKRCQDIARKYSVPYLASGHHKYGETSEILYWYPGVSKYDAEYILRDRYKAHENGKKSSVSSKGSPIFNTTRLNALCEKIALGMLTYPDEIKENTKFSSFLKYHPNRNYILIRQMDISLNDNDLECLFTTDERYLYDDVVWLDPDDLIDFVDDNFLKEESETKVEDIINDLNVFESGYGSVSEPKKTDNIILFIGDYKYNNKVANNVNAFGSYYTYNFSEVAFICDKHTLDLYSIMSILLGSMDKASYLLDYVLKNGKADMLAKFLWYKKHVFLVNEVMQKSKIERFLLDYQNHIIFLCGKNRKILKNMNVKKTNGKYDFIFMSNHPSSKSYINGFQKNCQTYIARTYQDTKSNLQIDDFKVF